MWEIFMKQSSKQSPQAIGLCTSISITGSIFYSQMTSTIDTDTKTTPVTSTCGSTITFHFDEKECLLICNFHCASICQ